MDNLDVEMNELNALTLALEDIGNSLRILAQSEFEQRLLSIFSSSEELRVYELSDGERTTREIAELVGHGKDWVSELWQKWASKHDILQQQAPRKPYKAKFSLLELALRQRMPLAPKIGMSSEDKNGTTDFRN